MLWKFFVVSLLCVVAFSFSLFFFFISLSYTCVCVMWSGDDTSTLDDNALSLKFNYRKHLFFQLQHIYMNVFWFQNTSNEAFDDDDDDDVSWFDVEKVTFSRDRARDNRTHLTVNILSNNYTFRRHSREGWRRCLKIKVILVIWIANT